VAVFRCTREVAEAVIADQQRLRGAERARLAADGLCDDELTARLDEAIAPMWLDGDVVATKVFARFRRDVACGSPRTCAANDPTSGPPGRSGSPASGSS
jgi:hypothetical protein